MCSRAAQVGKSFAGPRDALAMNGSFILTQLQQLEGMPSSIAQGPFATALQQEVRPHGEELAFCGLPLHFRRVAGQHGTACKMQDAKLAALSSLCLHCCIEIGAKLQKLMWHVRSR